MKEIEVKFENADKVVLAGKLVLPSGRKPVAYSIFAHCFSCGKDLRSARIISNKLSAKGIAVLRFDFAGLGESEGEFGDSAISGNIKDLIAASNFLKTNYQAPSLLIGHSLGGAAVIRAAKYLEDVKAIVVIAAPFDVRHIKNLFSDSIEHIKSKGKAEVVLAGRRFNISNDFLDDISSDEPEKIIKNLNKALLIMHSPQDTIVSIDNAAAIYTNAMHPKSFISLDGADHLLKNSNDAKYAAEVIASWLSRYVDRTESDLKTDKQTVANTSSNSFLTEINAGGYELLADEPEDVGGSGLGPSPYDLLTAALGACTSMTLQMYAGRKSWDLAEVNVHVQHSRDHAKDCNDCDKPTSKIDLFEREIELIGNLDEKQKSRLMEIADKCPVHKTLENKIEIRTVMR